MVFHVRLIAFLVLVNFVLCQEPLSQALEVPVVVQKVFESSNASRESLVNKLFKVLESITGRFFSSWVQTKDGSFPLSIGVVVKFG